MTKYEYFENGVWHKTNQEEYYHVLPYRKDYHQLVNKYFCLDNSEEILSEYWFLGTRRHRLDGPSDIIYLLDGPAHFCTSNGIMTYARWFVNGFCLPKFQNYYKRYGINNISQLLFDYLREYPHFIKEIILLAEHNQWLTEEQLVLIKCEALFL